jgi:hypothetical protein
VTDQHDDIDETLNRDTSSPLRPPEGTSDDPKYRGIARVVVADPDGNVMIDSGKDQTNSSSAR